MRQSLLVLVPVIGLMVGSAALPVAAPARAEPQTPARQCFFHQQIDNFRSGTSGALYLRVRGGDIYEVTSAGACTDVADSFRLAVLPEAGSSRLCTGDWVTLVAPDETGHGQTCRAHLQKKLTEAEVAALPARDRP